MDETKSNKLLEPLIFVIRAQRVVLDADLARLYGVDTFRFNETFKRNRRRFPADFAFQLTPAEFENLRSRIATSSSQAIDSIRHNSSQFAMSSQRGHRYLPWAFTEHGARDLYRKLLPLLQPPADPPKRRIGFHTDDK